MTKAEIAATVDELTNEERAYMGAYIKMKSLVNDAAYRKEMSDRSKSIKSGNGLSRDQVLDLHNKLSEQGL